MSYSSRNGLFARFRSLLRGVFSVWIRDREHESPEAVYEQAIAERVRQYRDLKSAVAGILYLRNKLEAEIGERRAEIARLHDDARRAVRRGQDELSLTLISQKQGLFGELERAESEYEAIKVQSGEAKDNLVRFREEIRSLVREKGRMLATLANAQARRRLQVALEGLSVDAEMDALESVREHVSRLVVEGSLEKEIGDTDPGLRTRLREFRDEARNDAALAELEQMKRDLGSHQLAAEAVRVSEPMPAAASA